MKLRSKAAVVGIVVIAVPTLAVAVTRAAASSTPAKAYAGSPSRFGPGSPGWDQLDPWMQNAILNGPAYDSAGAFGPGSPGWDQLDPGMQNAILNGPAYDSAG